MSISLKTIYRFNANSVKITTKCFVELEWIILKCVLNDKTPSFQSNLEEEKQTKFGVSGSLTSTKLRYKAIVLEDYGSGKKKKKNHKHRSMEHWIESSDINTYTHTHIVN